MQKPYLKIKLLNDNAILPSKRDEDAGFDLYTTIKEDFVILKPGNILSLPTGIAIEIPRDWVFYIAERSSSGSKGLARRCGVIDSGYRGEISIPINNTSNKTIVLARDLEKKLDEFLNRNKLNKKEIIIYPLSKAIAQGMLIYCPHIEVKQVNNLNESSRGSGAFGSTGK